MSRFGKALATWVERLGNLKDTNEVARDLAHLVRHTTSSSWEVIYLFNPEQRDFLVVGAFGLSPTLRRALVGKPLASTFIASIATSLRRRQQLIITPDKADTFISSTSWLERLTDTTILSIPMVTRNQVTGGILAGRQSQLPPLTDDDLTLVREMASHAALVIGHMRLFDESLELALDLGRRLDVILSVEEINKAISSSLSREEIMTTAMVQIERITRWQLVALLTDDHGTLRVAAMQTSRDLTSPTLVQGQAVSDPCLRSTAIRQGKSCLVTALKAKRRNSPLETTLAMAGIDTLLVIPLMGKTGMSGMLLLARTTNGPPTKEETFTIEKIASQLVVALENARLYEELGTLFINTVASLANAIDAKSPWTKGHSQRVMHLAEKIARAMGLPQEEVEQVRLGGLLHDIGKIGILEALLDKPEALSDDEFPPMRLHPEIGVSILSPIEQLKNVLPAILHHHEWYDGSGYPKGLKGNKIPLSARIITVADSFDAMVADRPYKKGFTPAEALDELENCSGTQFDPKVVKVFSRLLANNVQRPATPPHPATPPASQHCHARRMKKT